MTDESLESKKPTAVQTPPGWMSRITRNERICGGEPIIRGMRITIRAIVEYMEIYNSKERILKALPDLTIEDIDAALVYYHTHREEIERYRQEEEDSENWTALPNLYKR
jgi:uncharacterized protein (DUF433 family)